MKIVCSGAVDRVASDVALRITRPFPSPADMSWWYCPPSTTTNGSAPWPSTGLASTEPLDVGVVVAAGPDGRAARAGGDEQQQHREQRGCPDPACHPFRPLRATPSTMFRWARMNSTIAGTLAIAAPAITTG